MQAPRGCYWMDRRVTLNICFVFYSFFIKCCCACAPTCLSWAAAAGLLSDGPTSHYKHIYFIICHYIVMY